MLLLYLSKIVKDLYLHAHKLAPYLMSLCVASVPSNADLIPSLNLGLLDKRWTIVYSACCQYVPLG